MRAIFFSCLLIVFASEAAFANDTSLPPGLTGDWNGTRTDLADEGWQFQVKGTFEGAYNPSGGDHSSAAGAGELDFVTLADLGKLIGDEGGSIEAKITDRFGANLVQAGGLDTLMQVQEIWGRGDIWRLTELSFSQNIFDNKLNVELGRLNPGGDFDTFSCNFQNLNFCGAAPGNIVGDYWFNSPVSQWGGRLKWTVSDEISLEGGVYQINPVNMADGFTFDFSGGKGALLPFAAEWKPTLLGGLPGDYKIGGWYSNMRAPDVFLDVNRNPLALTGLAPLSDRGRSGLYLSLKQQITGEAPSKDAPANTNGQGLTLFLNYTRADRRTSMLDRQLALGAIYKGAIPSRADDEIALAFGTTHVNDRVAMGETLNNAADLPFEAVQHTEYVTELDYRAQIAQGTEVTPNLQYIADPGGVPGRHDIVVAGLKAAVSL